LDSITAARLPGHGSLYSRGAILAAALLAATLLAGVAGAEAATLDGKLESGNKPIKRAPVTLFKTSVDRTGPVAIGQDRSDRRGRVSINYGTPGRANSLL
jgi:hypothetical protein